MSLKLRLAFGVMSASVIAGVGLLTAAPAKAEGVYDGLYLGATGGYVIGQGEFSTPASSPLVNEEGKSDLEGGMIGGLVGYDHSFGNGLVVGVAGDISWLGVDSQITNAGSAFSQSISVDWLGTVRGRIGFEMGDALIYGTGGLAFGGVETSLNLDGSGELGSDSATQIGWTVGAGVNYMLNDNLMLGIEYLYVDLGESKHDYGLAGNGDIDVHMNIIRGTVGFRF